MSASDPNSAIFMSDTAKEISKKINKSFSGGRETLEEHQRLGGNPDVDVPYQYLTYFEEDDAKLKSLYDGYKAGTVSTGDMKKECITHLQKYVAGYQSKRKQVTDEVLASFMKPRKLIWAGNPNPKKPPPPEPKAKEVKKDGDGSKTKEAKKQKPAANDAAEGGIVDKVVDAVSDGMAKVGLTDEKSTKAS